jgi:7-carboxy-7-deazaguanine synthase
MKKMERAMIHEIFTSIQGEGPWIGERHIFVRFVGCDLRCRYCDTPNIIQVKHDDSSLKFCRIQTVPDLNKYEEVPNPVSVAELTAFCTRYIIPGPSRPILSLTGGEPLLNGVFLAEWLPKARNTFKIYLETNGIHAGTMHDLRDVIDIVSIDFKLPTATGLRPFWEEHKQFLSAARGISLFVKSVVTRDTKSGDIATAARIIAGFDRSIPFILQPASGPYAPDSATLIEFQRIALGLIEDVRVIPQVHKILHLP